jgi:uncharacterized membrane protein YfcA
MEILIGLLIGFAIGTTGVGGGTLTAPALILILGFTPRTSVATALIFSATVKLSAVAIYAWKSQVKYRVLTYLLLGGVSGAVVGSLVIEHFRSGRSEAWVLLIVGLTITASAIAGLVVRPKVQRNAEHKSSFLLPPAFAIGIETGFSSAGAGALGSLLLLNFTNLSPAAVVGTDLSFGLITSASGGIVHAFAGGCNWTVLANLVPAGMVGTFAGAMVSHRLPSRALRVAILICAALVGILLCLRSVREL